MPSEQRDFDFNWGWKNSDYLQVMLINLMLDSGNTQFHDNWISGSLSQKCTCAIQMEGCTDTDP